MTIAIKFTDLSILMNEYISLIQIKNIFVKHKTQMVLH